MNYQKEPALDYHDIILLDTGSVLDLTANHEFTMNVQPSKTLLSMATNAGHKTIAMGATVPGYGTTWYDEKSLQTSFHLLNYLTNLIHYGSSMTPTRKMPSWFTPRTLAWSNLLECQMACMLFIHPISFAGVG
jgi:hypothetical protein